MIEDFTFDTDASPANMNNIIKNINKNEEDITAVKESVEEVGSQIGQMVYKEAVRELKGVLSNMDLDTVFTPGLYHLNSTCINMPIAGNGFLQVTPHIKGGTTYILQEVTMWAISPYYMRRFQRVMLNGVWHAWGETSFIGIPTETVITSGFPTGWTGEIRYGKPATNIVWLSIPLIQRDIDFSSGDNTIYTLPVGFRPTTTVSTWCYVAPITSGDALNGDAMVALIIIPDGRIIIQNVGVTRTNIKRIMRSNIVFWGGN